MQWHKSKTSAGGSCTISCKIKSLVGTVLPANADQTVTYYSSNKNVVTVDENGWLSPQQAGKAVITASTVNGLEAACNVQVYTLS